MAIAEIKGEKVTAKLWVPIHEVESGALDQIRNVASLPWTEGVSIMPDVHLGTGCTIGTVLLTKEAVVPSVVGVDPGCVDGETEFLSPTGWKRIDEYDGESPIMQFDPHTGEGCFVKPTRYVNLPSDGFFHIRTKYGVDQMLSPEHKVLYYTAGRSRSFRSFATISTIEMVNLHRSSVEGFSGRFQTTFRPVLDTRYPLSDAELRVAVMVAADGHIRNSNTRNCVLQFKKDRKIARALKLLNEATIPYTLRKNKSGTSSFSFTAPVAAKSLREFWSCSCDQLMVIVDEVFRWDGYLKDRVYYTRDKDSADFVSYAIAATGCRSVLRTDVRECYGTSGLEVDYRVFAHDNTKVGIKSGSGKPEITCGTRRDRKYCFTVPSGFWVMRRSGLIAMTGNCGMMAVQTNLIRGELPRNLGPIREAIEAAIPVGFNSHSETPDFAKKTAVSLYDSAHNGSEALTKIAESTKFAQQVGTLGGGNHFIELCHDKSGRVWIMLHSGSRNFGKCVADYYQHLATKLEHNKYLPDRALSAFLSNSKEFEDYLFAMQVCQEYARVNRETMMELIHRSLEMYFPKVDHLITVACHHNYIAEEIHRGSKHYVTRKGAIRAENGEWGIIPGAMGNGSCSYITFGKGNEEAFNSAPHGAGRAMSRGAAKRKFTVDDLREVTEGIECRKDKGVIDEIQMSYKPIADVMEHASDLVTPGYELHALLCIKG